MDSESEMKMVVSIMKSIIVSVKGGLPFHKLDGDYREQNGQRIPYSKFGFRSLEDFVRSISEVKMCKVDGSTLLSVVDPKMAHIKSLLDRQKPAKKRVRPPKRGFFPSRVNYGRQGARPVFKGPPPRAGGYSYRPVVSAPVAPRMPPPVWNPVQSTNGNGSREQGHGDGPRPRRENFYPRPLATGHQKPTNAGNKTVQPEPVAYSNTHSIRQGKGFVEYIPRDKHTGEQKPDEDKAQVNGTNSESPLSKRYSDFMRQLKEKDEAEKKAKEEADKREKEEAARKVNGHAESDRNGHSVSDRNGHSVRQGGRGRGVWRADDSAPTRAISRSVADRQDPEQSHVTNGLDQEPLSRTVEFNGHRGVGDSALTITIANDFVKSDDDDDDDDWSDYDDGEQDEESYLAYQKLLLRPKFRNHQLIGDDFLLHFAYYIDEPCQEKDGRLLESGLCISGLTLTMCMNEIHRTDIISDRLIVHIGVIDILEGLDISTLKLRLNCLLNQLLDKNVKHVYVCTVPLLAHLSKSARNVCNLYNTFLKSYTLERITVIDLETEPFVDKDKQLCASFFEENDIQPGNGFSPSMSLPMWNGRGLEALRTVFQTSLG